MPALVIDTNLLCLIVVGSISREQIARHKRLQTYSAEDFDNVVTFLRSFDPLIVCPHVLAECSNLIRQTAEPLRTLAGQALSQLTNIAREQHVPAVQVMAEPAYDRLGLTDAVMLALMQEDRALLTDDLDLYLTAQRRGIPSFNYSHLREGLTIAGSGMV